MSEDLETNTSRNAADAVTSALGPKLRSLRQERGQTLRQVAANAHISASLLSQIERGDVSPSLTTLVTVAHALAIRPGALLVNDETEHSSSPVVRRSERRVMSDDMCRREYLMHLDDPNLEVAEIFLEPHGVSMPVLTSHAGRDYGIVIEGTVTVELEDRRETLEVGDYVAFDAEIPHRLANETDQQARLFWIIAHGQALSADPAKHRLKPNISH